MLPTTLQVNVTSDVLGSMYPPMMQVLYSFISNVYSNVANLLVQILPLMLKITLLVVCL